MLRHIVLFQLDGFASPQAKAEHLEQIRVQLEALTQQIECLEGMKVSINCNPQEDFDFVLEALLQTLDEVKNYSEHPAHQRIVKELIAPYKVARACVDIEY